ncbi:hypothetical protein JOB18_026697 [Solea senegalensis]|uniref:Uncharacterized protein n=1 Tax=Solea senegalensis TaxID=28829 RepID=A0AAV6RFP3_SOLSE|nr:hypothetical protein JOB18_026697 [Solea senegalensis]
MIRVSHLWILKRRNAKLSVLSGESSSGWWPVQTGKASSIRGTVINPEAVKLGRKPRTTSHCYLSTFQ